MDDLVDIGVYGRDPDTPIYLRKHRVRSGESEIVVEVTQRPTRAGIDPLHKLIDRDVDDNLQDVTRRAGTPVRRNAPPADSARPAGDSAN